MIWIALIAVAIVLAVLHIIGDDGEIKPHQSREQRKGANE